MKSLKLFVIAAAVTLVASCGVLSNGGSNATSTNTNASAGTSLGAALLGLYTQYKTDGKIDWSNLNNILNIATIASSIKGNTNAFADNAFVSDVVSGSKNLVTKDNAATVIEQLAALANINLNQVTNTAKGFSQGAANATASAINTSSASIVKATNVLNDVFATIGK